MANNTLPLALLIDAENVSCNLIDRIMHETDKLGDPIIRRIYGNFTSPNMSCWHEISERHAFTVAQKFAYKKGKNATDIELIMDAVTLQFTSPIRGLVLVSGDSDYCGLVKRYREQNWPVYVLGQSNTSEALKRCCTAFIPINDYNKPTTTPSPTHEPDSLFRVKAPVLSGPTVVGKIDLAPNSFIQQVLAILQSCANVKKPVAKSAFLQAFQLKHGAISIREKGYKTWNAFFTANPNYFVLEQRNNEYFIVF